MKAISFVLMLFLSNTLLAEEGILGYWLTPGSIVKIENCDTYVCAKIETIFVDDGRDPKLILDENNKDKALRSRAIVGINVLSGFLIKDVDQRDFRGGRIYDPKEMGQQEAMLLDIAMIYLILIMKSVLYLGSGWYRKTLFHCFISSRRYDRIVC